MEEGDQQGLCGELGKARGFTQFRNRALIYFCYLLKISNSPFW